MKAIFFILIFLSVNLVQAREAYQQIKDSKEYTEASTDSSRSTPKLKAFKHPPVLNIHRGHSRVYKDNTVYSDEE